ncbi:MAG: RdgB/HAM1 family non-canonical purine NTP pyrophosphatase [bacterium]|nr:RdgB/HAM1 family non-canonical purine NTP pyrophosphatase [bacterium]
MKQKILIASKNPHKQLEIQSKLYFLDCEVVSLLDVDDGFEVAETGSTFEENAILKATLYARHYQMSCIADDSGLCVKALHGEPGVYSARYSSDGTDESNLRKLLKEIKHHSDRRAEFKSVICFSTKEGSYRCFFGSIEGMIEDHPIYQHGFGYDPIFYVPSIQKMLSQCTIEEKNQISHRAIALQNLMEEIGGFMNETSRSQ